MFLNINTYVHINSLYIIFYTLKTHIHYILQNTYKLNYTLKYMY